MATALEAPARTDAPSRIPRPNLATLLFLFLLAIVYCRPLADLDFAWQIRTGAEVVRDGPLHITDSFTYTIAGKQLPDFEWLYEVTLWGVWSLFGYGGLHLAKTFCVLAPLALVAWRLRRERVARHLILAALAVAVLALIPTWNLRPFVCTTLGLLLLSGWLHDHCTGRRPLSWETPLLMLLWANCHPGVITGQGLIVGAIGWEWLNRGLRWQTPLSRASCWRLTLFGGLGLVASLVCPGPLERLRYTFNPDLAHPIMRGFVEMQPLYVFALRPPFLAALIYVVAALVLVSVVLRFRRYRLWEVALLAGTALLANVAFRSAQDWLLIMLTVGAPHVAALFLQAARWHRRRRRCDSFTCGFAVAWQCDRLARHVAGTPGFRFQRGWALTLVLLLSVFSLTPMLAGSIPRTHGKDWPEAALDFIEEHDLRGRFFSNPNHGTYLVWRRGPERALCYVDTRGFYFPPRLLEDSYHIPHLGDAWQERLRRVLDQGTDYFLLETDGPPGALWQALAAEVSPLYRDEQTVLVEAGAVRRWLDARP
jgi:hypothetical protein